MAWVDKRGKKFRLLFRFNHEKYVIGLKESDPKAVDAAVDQFSLINSFAHQKRLVYRAMILFVLNLKLNSSHAE